MYQQIFSPPVLYRIVNIMTLVGCRSLIKFGFGLYASNHASLKINKFDVDPVARLKSFRALKLSNFSTIKGALIS